MPKTTVDISARFTGLYESAVKDIARLTGGQGLHIKVNSKPFNDQLNSMTGNVRSFEKALDFSNRRVIAFGTSASIVYGMVRGFKELLSATVEVEKTLTSINSIFGLSPRNLDSFSKSLFNVARQTGQAFSEVATAAEEFSRQGLGVDETLKRTRDTMILVRLTGLDTAKAVGTLTAALSTFSKAGEDSTTILNKVVAADQKFAVSARDIAEAFQRVGSVVDDAGVSIDQFIGLVTAAKQITSRDGAVIGNSLKTILTRLERSSTLDDLEALGVAVRDAAGNAKPALQVFDELAKSYNTLGREQQNLVAQLGGGVFQINQFKALMLDLGKANGIASQAEKTAAGATNEAIVRNATLNNTLATSIQNLQTSATQAASVVGSLSFKPALQTGIDLGSLLTKPFQNLSATGDTKPAEDFGKYIGESILKGIGNVLAGPGLVFIARAVGGVINRARPEIVSDIQAASGLVSARPGSFVGGVRSGLAPAGEAEAITRTNQLIAMGTKEEQARFAAAKGVAEQEAVILSILERQVQVMYAAAAPPAVAPAIRSLRSNRRTPFGASGYIPMAEEAHAISMGVGGAPSSARPVYLSGFNRGGGQTGIVANTSEFKVPGAAGGAIFNRDMIRKYGLPPGSTPVAAGGYVPYAAGGRDYPGTNLPNERFPTDAQRAARGAGSLTEGAFGSTDLKQGSPIRGLALNRHDLQILNDLFHELSTTASKVQAAKLSAQITESVSALDKLSSEKVLTKLGHEYTQAKYRSDDVRQATKVLQANDALAGFAPYQRRFSGDATNQAVFGINGQHGRSSLLANLALDRETGATSSGILQHGPFREQILAPVYAKVEQDRLRRERAMEGRYDDPFQREQALSTLQGRNDFYASSDSRQRGIAFDRATSRVKSGNDITPAQQQLVKDVFEQKAHELAAKTFAPGASQAAIKGFVRSYADKMIDQLNEAGNAALTAKAVGAARVTTALTDAEIVRRAQKRASLAGSVQNALLVGSFASGFIPKGESGQASGQGFGALSSGLQGGATGAFLGSIFGPAGTLIGAGIGGLGGAVKGFIDRTAKSFEELAAEIEKDNEKLKGQVEAVSHAFELQGRISEGGLGKGGLGRARRDLSGTLAKVTDPELRRLVNDGSAEAQLKAAEILADRQQKASIQQALQLTFKKAIVEGDHGSESLTATAGALQSSYANLSSADLARIAAETGRSQYGAGLDAIKNAGGTSFLGRVGGLLQGTPLGGIGQLLEHGATLNAGAYAQDARLKAINAEQQRRSDEAADEARLAKDTNRISRVESLRIANRLGVQGQLASIRAGGAGQITQGLQQIALDQPGLTEERRLAFQGAFGRQNISAQFAASRASSVATGTSGLRELLTNAGVTDRGLLDRVSGATGKSDLIGLQGDLSSVFATKAPAETLKQAQSAIKDLVNSLTVLNASEEEAIRVNDQLNDALAKQLATSRTVGAVQANLQRDLTLSRRLQGLNDQATINLAGNPATSELVSGDMLTGAKFGQADRAGSKGKSGESFARGFGAVFAGAAHDARNFAQVGQQVAASLRDNFANAFGDFVTGAKKAKDAFRDFIVGVLAESARAFATKAVTSLLGALFSGIGGGYNKGSVGVGSASVVESAFNTPGKANGGYISRAAGGLIPTMLTGGELVYPPAQAARIGGRMLNAVNGGTARGFAPGGLVRGGSGVKDDVFQPLAAGSFVVRKAMVERYGVNNLTSLSIGGSPEGGAMASMMAPPAPMAVVSGGGGNVNISVNVTDNSTTSQTQSSNQPGQGLGDRQFSDLLARRVKQVTLQTIEEQTRSGGLLRIQGLRAST